MRSNSPISWVDSLSGVFLAATLTREQFSLLGARSQLLGSKTKISSSTRRDGVRPDCIAEGPVSRKTAYILRFDRMRRSPADRAFSAILRSTATCDAQL